MATEYYQIPSSQGLLSLEASTSSFTSSVLSSSGAFPSSAALSASTMAPVSDPWLSGNSLKSMSLDDWGPMKKNTPPSLFEPDDIEARSWENIIPQQTPEVLKASFELKNSYEIKNPHKVPANKFLSTSSKLDAWSVIDPSVTISSPLSSSLKLSGSTSSLRRSTASMQDDDENSLNRYKTELCKSFTETGVCRYGVKCQFAHGKEELRSVLRHPKYKTEVCKTFHNTGTCPYGLRCRFIHTRTKEEGQVLSSSTSSFIDSDFDDEDDHGDGNKMTPPPGFAAPQWSKSWTPTGSPVIRNRPPKKVQA